MPRLEESNSDPDGSTTKSSIDDLVDKLYIYMCNVCVNANKLLCNHYSNQSGQNTVVIA